MGLLANFFVSFLCCVVVYVVGVVVIKLRTPPYVEYNTAYITWLKWNLILCLWFTWPAFGILLSLLFPDPHGLGLFGGLL